MTITAVSLDWGDTLAVNYGRPYQFIQQRALADFAKALADCGGTVPPSWLDDCHAELHECWAGTVDPAQNPEKREFDYAQLIRNWVERCGIPKAAALPAIEAYTATITDTVIPMAGVSEALAELKAMGLRVGICSHVPWPGPACKAWYQRYGLFQYIDFWSLSCEVGWIKPAQQHFEHTLAEAATERASILHVGDHPMRDIHGGHAFGFHTALVMTEGIYDPDELASCPADARISHINELPTIIAHMNDEVRTTP